MTKIVPYDAPEDADDHEDLGRPFRVVAVLRNNRLIRAREELGLSSPKAAVAIGVSYGTLNALESLKGSPWNKHMDDWSPSALKIAAYYGYSPEELWPDIIKEVRATKALLEVATPALSLSADASTVNKELREAVAKRLHQLTPRYQQVLAMRFGFDGGDGKTIAEVADHLKLSRERTRQIELKALRHLQHPAIAKQLAPFADIDVEAALPSSWVPSTESTCQGCGAVVLTDSHHPRQEVQKKRYGIVLWVCDRTERKR